MSWHQGELLIIRIFYIDNHLGTRASFNLEQYFSNLKRTFFRPLKKNNNLGLWLFVVCWCQRYLSVITLCLQHQFFFIVGYVQVEIFCKIFFFYLTSIKGVTIIPLILSKKRNEVCCTKHKMRFSLLYSQYKLMLILLILSICGSFSIFAQKNLKKPLQALLKGKIRNNFF
jgi:hypothetical protein